VGAVRSQTQFSISKSDGIKREDECFIESSQILSVKEARGKNGKILESK
jgi:hypothetical protein